jgi:hypothetical protein
MPLLLKPAPLRLRLVLVAVKKIWMNFLSTATRPCNGTF